MSTKVPASSGNQGTPKGKLRWREHEASFVSILFITWVISCIWKMIRITEQELEGGFKIPYQQHQLSFSYPQNVLLPQVGAAFLLVMIYYAINGVLVPQAKKISFKATTAAIIWRIILVVVLFFVLSWLLALGINVATWYAHPWFFNYGGFQVLALMGYNDQPMQDLFFGVDRAINVVAVVCLLALIREVIIHYVERRGPGRSYRVLIGNQVTLFALIYFSLLAVVLSGKVNPGSNLRITYAAFVPATFLVFMVNTYWVFPRLGEGRLLRIKILAQMVVLTFLCSFPFFTVKGLELPHNLFVLFMLCWGIQLFVTTPMAWLIYQQRKDKILQLQGMEKALEQSKADLQFLRSQINPHFLFNALNTLYGTALREKAPDSAAGIQMLGDMMRFMLHENHQDLIPMSREVEYLNNYMALQKLRTPVSPDMVIEDDLEQADCNHQIAPMILIPFVENAFKHGVSLQEKSWIKVVLTCDEKQIRFEVRNSVHARAQHDPEKDHSGIGLQNVLERLNLLYPGRHEINIQTNEQEYIVQLSIQP